MTQPDEAAELETRGQLFDKLVQVSMGNMTIPQAKVFAIKVQIYVDLYLVKAQARTRQQLIRQIREEVGGKAIITLDTEPKNKAMVIPVGPFVRLEDIDNLLKILEASNGKQTQ